MTQEGWCAFALAILGPVPLLPEQAFIALDQGRNYVRLNQDDIIPEIIGLHEMNVPWREIDEIYGFKKRTAICITSRWKKKRQREVNNG